jgi:hypothetical protein
VREERLAAVVRRLPTVSAATTAAAAAFTCTTVPPAKSSAPSVPSHPFPHTQCATGAYTTRLQRAMNPRYGPKRIRSTTAPEMSAAVMMAKVPWYAMNSRCGVPPQAPPSSPTPRRKA